MLLVLQHADGRWCEPAMSDGAITDEAAAQWAEAVCETLGLPAETLTPHLVADDADPRSGELITDPHQPVDAPPQPTPLEIIATALLADAGTSQAVKDAAQQALIAGGVQLDTQIPLVPKS